MGAWALERGILWVLELPAPGPALVLPRIEAVFDEVPREAAGPLAEAMGLPDAAPVLRRLAAGRRCFAARAGGRLASYGWVSRAAECIGEQEREIRLEPDEAYIWDCATLPAFRRLRLYSALLGHIAARLGQEGVRRAWIGSSLDNGPSLRGFANAGFRPVVQLIHVRIFSLRCLWLSSRPAAPASLAMAARRALIRDDERGWGPMFFSLARPALLAACAQLEA